jgi:hypothetical protein
MTPHPRVHALRRMLRYGYITQAISVLASTVCLYTAIDNWLTGRPFWSAVMTALAFWNGCMFIGNQEMMRETRAELRRQQ